MNEDFIHVYISTDQHLPRFRKLEKQIRNLNAGVVLTGFGFVFTGLLFYIQEAEIEALREQLSEKEEKKAE